MRSSARIIVASTIFVIGVVLSGCSVSVTAPNGQTTHCTPNVQNVHKSTGSPGYMDTKATVRCTGAPAKLVATLDRTAGWLLMGDGPELKLHPHHRSAQDGIGVYHHVGVRFEVHKRHLSWGREGSHHGSL